MFAWTYTWEKWLTLSSSPLCESLLLSPLQQEMWGVALRHTVHAGPVHSLYIHYTVAYPSTHLHATVRLILWSVGIVKFKSVQVESGETSRESLVVQDVPYCKCYCILQQSTACERFLRCLNPKIMWVFSCSRSACRLNYCSSSTVKFLVCGLLF